MVIPLGTRPEVCAEEMTDRDEQGISKPVSGKENVQKPLALPPTYVVVSTADIVEVL